MRSLYLQNMIFPGEKMRLNTILAAMLVLAALSFAIQPAENANWIVSGKYNQSVNVNYTTVGGNVTNLDLSSNISTEKWAGYWGNVTGRIVLAPSDTSPLLYSWAWDSTDGGEVCAIGAATGFNWATLQTPDDADIDNAFGLQSGDTDDTNSTLATSCSLDVAGQTPTGIGNLTGVGGFETCAVSDGGTARSNYAFCTNITGVGSAGALFNGQTGDYELIVPTNETAGATETYFFWLELN